MPPTFLFLVMLIVLAAAAPILLIVIVGLCFFERFKSVGRTLLYGGFIATVPMPAIVTLISLDFGFAKDYLTELAVTAASGFSIGALACGLWKAVVRYGLTTYRHQRQA